MSETQVSLVASGGCFFPSGLALELKNVERTNDPGEVSKKTGRRYDRGSLTVSVTEAVLCDHERFRVEIVDFVRLCKEAHADDFTLYMTHAYDDQCNLEFPPSVLLLLGENRIALAVSCFETFDDE